MRLPRTPRSARRKRLSALEKNILKYRAFEMVLFLFHVESLKFFVVESLRMAEQTFAVVSIKKKQTIKNFREASNVLVGHGILTATEAIELQRLVDFRNDIAHRVQELTADIGGDDLSRQFRDFIGTKYDYLALRQIKHFREKIVEGLSTKYITVLRLEDLLFDAAGKTYAEELARLRHRIERQLRPRATESENLAEAIWRQFAPFGGVELELPRREPARDPPDFTA